MNYIEFLREREPELAELSDDEIIQRLPQLDPKRFANRSADEVAQLARQDNNVLADSGRLLVSGANTGLSYLTTGVEQMVGGDWEIDEWFSDKAKSWKGDVDPAWRREIDEVGVGDGRNNTWSGWTGNALLSVGEDLPTDALGLIPITRAIAPGAEASLAMGKAYRLQKDRVMNQPLDKLQALEEFQPYLQKAEIQLGEGHVDATLLAREMMAEDFASQAYKEAAFLELGSLGLKGAVKTLRGPGKKVGSGPKDSNPITLDMKEVNQPPKIRLETTARGSGIDVKQKLRGIAKDEVQPVARGTLLAQQSNETAALLNGTERSPEQKIDELVRTVVPGTRIGQAISIPGAAIEGLLHDEPNNHQHLRENVSNSKRKDSVKPLPAMDSNDAETFKLSASGKPFNSQKSTLASIHSRLRNKTLAGSADDYEVLPVNGGYGYRKKSMTNMTNEPSQARNDRKGLAGQGSEPMNSAYQDRIQQVEVYKHLLNTDVDKAKDYARIMFSDGPAKQSVPERRAE